MESTHCVSLTEKPLKWNTDGVWINTLRNSKLKKILKAEIQLKKNASS